MIIRLFPNTLVELRRVESSFRVELLSRVFQTTSINFLVMIVKYYLSRGKGDFLWHGRGMRSTDCPLVSSVIIIERQIWCLEQVFIYLANSSFCQLLMAMVFFKLPPPQIQCVAFEGFVLYAGGGYALYPNIVLLVQVMAYVMSGTFVLDMVRRLTCAPESGPLIGSPVRTIRPALGRQSSRRVS